MLAELRGIYDMDFPDGKGGRIDGISLQLVYPDGNVIGFMTKGKFIRRDFCTSKGWTVNTFMPYLDKVVDLELDLKGHVIGIRSTDEKLS